MAAATKGSTDTMVEDQAGPRTENAGTGTLDNDATFGDASRQPSAGWLGPLLGGLFAAAVVILTLVTAVTLGAQEGMLVAGVGLGESSATPSLVPHVSGGPLIPSPTPTPSATPSPFSTLLSPSPTNSPVATTTTPCPVQSGWRLHVVQSGETLYTIAARYRTTAPVLQQINCLQGTALSQGQVIYVPGGSYSTPTRAPAATSRPRCYVRTDWYIYIVLRGDTLSSIAGRVNSSVQELMQGNCLMSDRIYAGQQLRVPHLPWPTRTPVPNATPTPTRPTTEPPTTEPPTTEPPTTEPPTTEPPTTEPPTTEPPTTEPPTTEPPTTEPPTTEPPTTEPPTTEPPTTEPPTTEPPTTEPPTTEP
jgi:LysM repeat protein